jgi:hypothetical protein
MIVSAKESIEIIRGNRTYEKLKQPDVKRMETIYDHPNFVNILSYREAKRIIEDFATTQDYEKFIFQKARSIKERKTPKKDMKLDYLDYDFAVAKTSREYVLRSSLQTIGRQRAFDHTKGTLEEVVKTVKERWANRVSATVKKPETTAQKATVQKNSSRHHRETLKQQQQELAESTALRGGSHWVPLEDGTKGIGYTTEQISSKGTHSDAQLAATPRRPREREHERERFEGNE